MEMTNEEIRKALEEPGKTSGKALSQLAQEIETEDPDRYKEILSKKDWEGQALSAYKAYRRALVLNRMTMVLAIIAVLGGYLAGDFGLQLLTGWLNRYAMAGGIIIGVSIFAGGTLLLNSCKERMIAYGVLEGM